MSKGTTNLLVTVLVALVCVGLLTPTTAVAQLNKGLSPSGGGVHHYPAYATRGGPYVVASTYYPGTPPHIVVVFNEDIDDAELGANPSEDFISDVSSASGSGRELTDLDTMTYMADGGVNDNVIWLGFDSDTPANNGFNVNNLDYIIATLPGEIVGVDGSVNTDVSPITIARGPVPVRVEVTDRENDFSADTATNDNTVIVTFDEDVAFVTNVGNAVGATPEFNGATLTGTIPANSNVLTITRSSGNNFLYMEPGVMALRIASGTMRYTVGGNPSNNVPYVRITENDGPLLLGAYYDPANPNDVRIVFDQVVASISDQFFNQFEAGGTWDPDDGGTGVFGDVSNATLLDWTNVLRHTGWTNPPVDDAGTISLADTYTLEDYQGEPALDGPAAPVHLGPGILRAWYYDNNSPTNTADDQLWLQLTDRLANGDDVTLAHFETEGFEFGPNTQVSYIEPSDPLDQSSKILFQNFNGSTNAFEAGDRIIPANTGPALETADGNPLYFAETWWTPVHDESRPSQVVIRDDNSEVHDQWIPDLPNELVTMFLRFEEDEIPGSAAGFEDSDQYFLFIVGPDETFDEALDQASRLEQAIPLGNLNPRRVSVTVPPERYNTTRLGLIISYGDEQLGDPPGWIYRTTSGLDITEPDGDRPYDRLRFFVAAADMQGNVTHVTDEYAWDELFARPSELDIRAFIQDPDCVTMAPDSLVLYALHYDLDPASVRFEYQLADSPTDYCGEQDPATTYVAIGTVSGDARGDRVVYTKKTGLGTSDAIRNDMEWFPFTYEDIDPFVYYYWDTDNDGRYTTQDPVIRSDNWESDPGEQYDGPVAGDFLVIGTDEYTETIPLGTPLTRFTTYDTDNPTDSPRDPYAYYWAQAAGESPNELDDSDVIFRENTVNYEPSENGDAIEGLNLWTINWDGCAELPDDVAQGNFLLRAIARDLFGNEDQIDQECVNEDPNVGNPDYAPEEVIWATLNNCTLAAWNTNITAFTAYQPLYDDPTEVGGEKWEYVAAAVDTAAAEIPAHTNYLKVTATTSVPTPDGIAFRFFNPTDSEWYYLVANEGANLNLAIADLNGVPGYQEGDDDTPDYLQDQIVQDDGDFVFETGVDTVEDNNGNPNPVPNNQILLPLVGDPSMWIGPYTPGDPIPAEAIDTTAPYEAFLNLVGYSGTADFPFIAETVRNLEDACPAGELVDSFQRTASIRDWTSLPVPDIPVPVVTFIGPNPAFVDTVDVGHPLNDGTPYEVLAPIAERRLHIYARADYEDIASVRLWYRQNPACGSPTVWKQPAQADMDISTGDPWDEYPDINYPFEFRWKAGVLAEGNYQFYIEWTDSNGNVNPPLFLPYGFAINEFGGASLANVTREAPADLCEAGTSYDVGAIKCFTASLADATLEGRVAVRFYFTARIQGKMYTGADLTGGVLALDETVLDPTNGGLVICDADGDVIPDTDYTVAGDEITWVNNVPADDDVFYVSYNFGEWTPIGSTDTEAPYEACWNEESSPAGVPDPADYGWGNANAYDIIAVATIDIDGDGYYGDSESGLLSLCDIAEPIASENANHILVRTVNLPIVHLYGLDYENTPYNYPQQANAPANYWPGNPFGVSESENPGNAPSWEGKLSGNEANVFVTASTDQSASITGVNLSLFRQYEADPYKTVAMTKVTAGDDLDMIVTMYPEDYYEVRPAELAAATVTLMVQEGGAGPIDAYPMLPNADGDYVATATFATEGETYKYWFEIDSPTRDFEFADRRNNSGGPAPESWIRMPDEPEFWYYQLTHTADFGVDQVYRVKVEATDSLGRIGTNLFDGSDEPQGPIVFVYDRTAPTPVRMWAEPPSFGAATEGRVFLEVTDPVPPGVDVNVITTRTVVFQYNPTPGDEKNWLELGRDLDESDGWWVPYGIGLGIPDPLADTFDNDNDGIIDEDDEDEVVFELRAVIFDDAGFGGDPTYAGFPGSGNPTYYDANGLTIAYDGQAPYTVITTPHDGDVFAINGPAITITGSPTDTRPEVLPPARVLADDIDRVKFQFSDNNGATFTDIDPTPTDDDGDPWIEPTSPNQTEFTITVDPELFELVSDSYVWIRMIAEDIHGNTTSPALSPEDAEIIHIIVNDTVAPMAYFQGFETSCDCGVTDDLTEYTKDTISIGGVVVDPTHTDLTGVVGVDIEMKGPNDAAFAVVGTVLLDDFVADLSGLCPDLPADNDGIDDYFWWTWDTMTGPGGIYPEGTYTFQVTTLDTDGNRYTSPILLTVVIDRTGSDVVYSPDGGKPYTTVAPYSDNDVADPLTSLVVVPDPLTGDLELYVYTAESVDVGSLGVIVLQYRDPSFPGNDWLSSGVEFDYTPGLNIPGHKAWVAHVEDFVDTFGPTGFGLTEQPWEWRAFVQDRACNTNINLGAAITATVDFTPPTVWEITWDKPTNEVVTGEDITFTVRLKDNITDVDRVRILAIEPDDTEHLVGYGELTDADAIDLDGPNTLWKFQATWSFDEIVYRNTPLDIKVEAYDTAGNLLEYTDPTQITVLDNTAPDRTKIFGVQGLVYYVNDALDGENLPAGGFDPTCLVCNDDVFIDVNDNGTFQFGVDILVSGGVNQTIVENAVGTPYGALLNTYPQDAREGFLNVDTNVLKVNNLVTVIARTQGGDDNFGADDGIAYVEFWATNKATGENILLGKDEHVPGFPSYLWHIGVDVTATNFDGTPLFDEGAEYNFWAKAVDLSGNEEVAPFEPTPAEIVPDMTAPIATMDADVNAAGVQQTAQAQRNEVFTLFAFTENVLEDDDVTFYMKRERDLNVQGVWDAGIIQNDWVVDGSSDENPATQRPYSFNLDLNKAEDPLTNNNPIPVGERYEFVGAAMDEVGNMTTAVDTRADATQRHITVEIIDTLAPPMTITEMQIWLDRTTGSDYHVENPDRVHAKDIGTIWATNRRDHSDLKEVMFLYRPQGGTDWTLIETVPANDDHRIDVSISNWDLTALTPDAWYELVAVGVDDVGNMGDPNTAEKVLVYVDHTAPSGFAFTAPTNADPYFCSWYEGVDEEKWFDLKITDSDATEDDDIYDVAFYYKYNMDVDYPDNWNRLDDAGYRDDVTHDVPTKTWSFRFDLDDWGLETNLYDVKAVIMDAAGNKSEVRVDRVANDTNDPTMTQITNIVDNTGVEIEFHPDGETEISEGVELRITGHAIDDELDLPLDRETPIASLQFEVSLDFGANWQAIGYPVENTTGALDFTGTVDWNTTGLPVDTDAHDPPTRIRVRALDSCGNESFSSSYIIRILDGEPPTARIVAFDLDQVPHGDTPVNMLHIYALAESDPQGYSDVMFQYDTVDETEGHEWVNIGVGAPAPCDPTDATYSSEDLWYTDLELTALPANVNQLWLRAIAKDDRGNYYDVESDVPVMLVDLVPYFEGGRTVKPVCVDDAENVIENVSIQMDSPEQAILEVTTTDASVRPRVVVLGESATPGDMQDNCWIYTAGMPSDPEAGSFGLVRSLEDDRVWRGKISLTLTYDLEEITDCEHFYVNVIGLTASKRIDHNFCRLETTTIVHEFPVTQELGTNGMVGLPMGDPTVEVEVPSGGWTGDEACLLMSPTRAPGLSVDEALYLEAVPGTAYYLDITKTDVTDNFVAGYEPEIHIMVPAEYANENLTVRRWDGEHRSWVATGIRNVRHENGSEHVIFSVDNFRLETVLPTSSGTGNVFQVFQGLDTAPISVERFVPESEYTEEIWTDADPTMRFYLRGNGQPIDPETVDIMIDDKLVASWITWGSADFQQGHIDAELYALNDEGMDAELVYSHSTLMRDWLANGPHTVTVRFRTTDGLSGYNTLTVPFNVDLTPPRLAFHSGFVTSPRLHNVDGYLGGPANSKLTVKAYDPESGILVRALRQEFVIDADGDNVIDPNEMNPNIVYDEDPGQENDPYENKLPIDWGMKYDLWVVNHEDDQLDIDELEQRTLLHTGNGAELWDQMTPPLYGQDRYIPADELTITLPVVGGGTIKDGDVVEVVLYSQKTTSHQGPELECVLDTLQIGGQMYTIVTNCWVEAQSQTVHNYQYGVLDEARNSASQYLEARFVVDMAPPLCNIALPGALQQPNEDMYIEVSITDSGVGFGSYDATVVGPDGPIAVEWTYNEDTEMLTATVPADQVKNGEYTITVKSKDLLGNSCVVTKTVRVEATQLALSGAYASPNPFDPAQGDADITFALSRTSDVTIKVYDFAGNYVTTLKNNESMAGGNIHVPWGGTASDGTQLANGAYIVRVTADDGGRTEVTNLKVVIWRD